MYLDGEFLSARLGFRVLSSSFMQRFADQRRKTTTLGEPSAFHKDLATKKTVKRAYRQLVLRYLPKESCGSGCLSAATHAGCRGG